VIGIILYFKIYRQARKETSRMKAKTIRADAKKPNGESATLQIFYDRTKMGYVVRKGARN
jgi:hypothetical protein